MINLQAQNVGRGYRQLEKEDYLDARDKFRDDLQEAPDNPAANFGMALVYWFQDSPVKDIVEVWKYASNTRNNLNKLTTDDAEEVNEYFMESGFRRTSRSVKKKIKLTIEDMQAAFIKHIRQENDLELVYRVIDEFPDFKYYDNVIHIRNQLEFRKYEKQNTLAGYLEFIEKFPDAAQIQKAKNYRNELAYQEAEKINTLEAYEGYMKKFPDAKDYSKALKKRNALAYQKAENINTIDAFENFISSYPKALEVSEAQKKLKKLYYERAKNIKTLQAYNDFIKRYPEGEYYIDIFNLKTLDLGNKFVSDNTLPFQNVDWSRGFDNRNKNDIACDLSLSNEEDYVLAGLSQQEDSAIWYDAWIIKLNHDGKMIWNTMAGNKLNDTIIDVEIDNENNILALGYTDIGLDSNALRGWMFKLNEEGKKVWNRNLGDWKVNDMTTTSDNDIIIGGYVKDDSLNHHYKILTLDDDGSRLWEREYKSIGEVNGLLSTDEGNIIVAGSHWLFSMDDKGYIQWETFLEDNDSITHAACNQTNIFLAGRGINNPVTYSYSISGVKKWRNTLDTREEIIYIKSIQANNDAVKMVVSTLSKPLLLTMNNNGMVVNKSELPINAPLSGIANINNSFLYQFSDEDIYLVKTK